MEVNYVYDDDYGTIQIIDYNTKDRTLTTICNGFKSKINTKNFLKGNIKKIIGKNEYQYNIGEIVFDKKGNCRKIVSRFKDRNCGTKTYKCLCLTCQSFQDVYESEINRGIGCGICGNRVVKMGLNDIYTTHPELIKYFKFQEDSMKYTYGSHKKVWVKCPICGFEKTMPIYSLVEQGFSCSRCSDGISYPNKVIANFLSSLGIEYTAEYSPEWAKNKRYDFLFKINNRNYIIEAHGKQHYCGGFERVNGRNYEQEKDNDSIKYEMALHNGFNDNEYIVIDCRESNIEFIKNNILKSKLNDLFDISIVNWKEIDKKSQSSLVNDVAKFYKNYSINIIEISNYFNISVCTVIRYLNKAKELDLCDYDSKEKQLKILRTNHKKNMKPILIKKENEIIGTFQSGIYIEKNSVDLFGIKLLSPQISKSAKSGKKYKGYSFEYIV